MKIFALANSSDCDHMNADGTFKGGFDGCVLHMEQCEGHSEESAKKICGSIAQAVANSGRPSLILENDTAIDADGWALIAPFGEHPKTRLVRAADGQIHEQRFIQVLDNAAADSIMSTENSMFRRLKRAMFGITAYKGHPDLRKHAPETLDNSGGAKPVTLGVLDKLRKTDRGIEGHFNLLPDQAEAVENEGYKYPSALWLVQPVGERDGAIVARPFKLLSVGLTPTPNISGVDSLANARANTPAATTANPNNDQMKSLLIGWLAANGITLANDATDSQVFEAIQRHATNKTTEVTTLGNERTSLNTKVTTLENEKTRLTTQLTEANTALSNAQTEAKTARADRAGYVVDLAIQKGILAVADRDARVAALTNSADFTKDADALLKEAVKHKVAGTIPGENADRKAVANAQIADPRKLFLGMVNKKMSDARMNYKDAYAAAAAENPALMEQMKAQTASSTPARY